MRHLIWYLILCFSLLAGCGSDRTTALTVGWAVGDDTATDAAVVFKTTDGINWAKITNLPIDPANLLARDVSAPDEQCAWITFAVPYGSGSGFVLRTVTGGSSWQNVTPPGHAADVVAVKALTRDIAWIAGSNGYIAATTDGGASWSTISVIGQAAGSIYTGITALDRTHVWVSGFVPDANGSPAETALVRTVDGASWHQLPALPEERNILGITATAPATLRLSTQETTNLYTSYDGGNSWSSVNLGNGDLNNVAAWGNAVWTAGDYATLMFSEKGDESWKQISLPSPYNGMWLLGLSTIGTQRIWVCGGPYGTSEGGLIWSDDGGSSWHPTKPAILGYDLWRISMVGGSK